MPKELFLLLRLILAHVCLRVRSSFSNFVRLVWPFFLGC